MDGQRFWFGDEILFKRVLPRWLKRKRKRQKESSLFYLLWYYKLMKVVKEKYWSNSGVVCGILSSWQWIVIVRFYFFIQRKKGKKFKRKKKKREEEKDMRNCRRKKKKRKKKKKKEILMQSTKHEQKGVLISLFRTADQKPSLSKLRMKENTPGEFLETLKVQTSQINIQKKSNNLLTSIYTYTNLCKMILWKKTRHGDYYRSQNNSNVNQVQKNFFFL